ncbi:hypothetical protein [Streptomyces sp. Ac-502]|uniref:hypothetical protein n=1 Tax=Streptomyces sp. Ac-502 TaxID=3342801 RepID=UPI003862B2DC
MVVVESVDVTDDVVVITARTRDGPLAAKYLADEISRVGGTGHRDGFAGEYPFGEHDAAEAHVHAHEYGQPFSVPTIATTVDLLGEYGYSPIDLFWLDQWLEEHEMTIIWLDLIGKDLLLSDSFHNSHPGCLMRSRARHRTRTPDGQSAALQPLYDALPHGVATVRRQLRTEVPTYRRSSPLTILDSAPPSCGARDMAVPLPNLRPLADV